MSGHDGAEHGAGHGIHLPPPSLSPVIISIGITFVGYGVLFGPALLAIGGVIFVVGLATWLIDDARAMVESSRHDGGHGGH